MGAYICRNFIRIASFFTHAQGCHATTKLTGRLLLLLLLHDESWVVSDPLWSGDDRVIGSKYIQSYLLIYFDEAIMEFHILSEHLHSCMHGRDNNTLQFYPSKITNLTYCTSKLTRWYIFVLVLDQQIGYFLNNEKDVIGRRSKAKQRETWTLIYTCGSTMHGVYAPNSWPD